MKTKNRLLTFGAALALSATLFAQGNNGEGSSNNNENKGAQEAKPKVMIEITEKALKNGKLIVQDDLVYLKIGVLGNMNGGKNNAIELTNCGYPGAMLGCNYRIKVLQ